MAIEIRETFQVAAPIEQVWSFMKSPENLAGCMPGASLTKLIDERSFIAVSYTHLTLPTSDLV